MKLSEIINFNVALMAIQNQTMPAPWPWAIRRNIQKVRPILDSFEAERKAFIEQYAVKDENGIAHEPYTFTDQAAADAAWQAIMDTEDDFIPYKVKESDLAKVDTFSAALIEAIEPMIEVV